MNEQTFIDYINELSPMAFSKEWLIWMLNMLKEANTKKVLINPAYLRATHGFTNDPEPLNFILDDSQPTHSP